MENETLLKKRLAELSHRAFERGYTTYSTFLNLQEISILKALKLDSKYSLFGGYENADRCVAAFSNDEVYSYPIVCIKIEPLQQKFSDKLTHRDFLGALMNLGIEREMLGDIKILNNEGYLFCLDKISQYIVNNLSSIKHTSVKCKIIDDIPELFNQLPDEEEYIVSSLRIDTVVSAVFKMSRNSASQLINQEKIFINSKTVYKDSVQLKEGDVVSVRGYGKFIYSQTVNETRKHKMVVAIRLYK
ncbi:YlmH/Sll1252 family protein [Eubacterium sp.]